MWKVYKVWEHRCGEMTCIYKVGKLKANVPVGDSNIEWNGFYSKDHDECQRFADELNRKEVSE